MTRIRAGQPTPLALPSPEVAQTPSAARLEQIAKESPGLDLAELVDAPTSESLKGFGVSNLQDLVRVMRTDPFAVLGNPKLASATAQVCFALEVFQSQGPGKVVEQRKNQLPSLDVKRLVAGRFEEKVPERVRPDPLILEMDGVVRGAQIFVRNASDLQHPGRMIELPVNSTQAEVETGNLKTVLADEWMKEHGVRVGDVLELIQRKGGRESAPTQVPMNGGYEGGQKIPAPNLKDAIWVGFKEVPPTLPIFALENDRSGTRIQVDRQKGIFDGSQVTLRARADSDGTARFCEPRASIGLVNVNDPGSKLSLAGRVGNQGDFVASVAAKNAAEAIVEVIADHSGQLDPTLDRSASLRVVSFPAGRPDLAVLATNPMLGISGRPTVALGRFQLQGGESGHGGQLSGRAAVTPGSLVRVINQETKYDFTTVAGPDGSFQLPASLFPGDELQITVRNPFTVLKHHPNVHIEDCETKLAVKVVGAGQGLGLVPVERDGRPPAAVTSDPVSAESNVDRAVDSEPRRRPLSGRVTGLSFSAATSMHPDVYGGSPVKLTLEPDSRVVGGPTFSDRNASSVKLDPETHTIRVTVDYTRAGGWEEKPASVEPLTIDLAAERGAFSNEKIFGKSAAGELNRAASWQLEVVTSEGVVLAKKKVSAELVTNDAAAQRYHAYPAFKILA
ncbi:MAG: hypothetical protein HY791_33035 [Deltaproteobacteria bacterium]|nr:hypothetical protein [Deltaproteobacteria bacterium]